jgi:hypothetical protein
VGIAPCVGDGRGESSDMGSSWMGSKGRVFAGHSRSFTYSIQYPNYIKHTHVVSIASAVVATTLTSSRTIRSRIDSFPNSVVPLRNTYRFSFCTRSFGFTKFRSVSVPCAVITHASMFEPEPRSLKMPAEIAADTSSSAAARSMSGCHVDSNTAIAASEPEPIVTYGSLSVDPCGATVNRCAPVESTPPRTSAAPIWPWYLRSGQQGDS